MNINDNFLPEKFIHKLKLLYSDTEYNFIIKSFYQKRSTSFRVNRLKSSSSEVVNNLQKVGISVKKIDFLPDTFILIKNDLRDLEETEVYKRGEIYVQSLSSMVPPLVLNPEDNDNVLDITAAPGSKTTQMASIMKNHGLIIANDTSRVRLFRLSYNLNLQGVHNTKILHVPGQAIWKLYPEYFDKVLVDVPCSMEGRFNYFDSKSYSTWSSNKVKELKERQKYILRSAISSTKVGGVIVYSTCTISPEENEEVIDWILKKFSSMVRVSKIINPNIEAKPGITSWNNKKLSPELSNTMRILPSGLMEGFFVAKLEKIKSSF